MKTTGYLMMSLLLCGLFAGTSNFTSPSALPTRSIFGIYESTTPCGQEVTGMLRISPDFKCEMMKWKLILYTDADIKTPTSFDLVCTYGLAKQASRDLQNGSRTLELRGKCMIGKEARTNPKSVVYNLVAEGSNIALSFFKADQNLLHLLTADKILMVGTAAWSYTLSRTEPVSASGQFTPRPAPQNKLISKSSIVGIFGGRTPCLSTIKKLHNITSPNCGVIKYQLTLFQDSITHSPSNFLLSTIYVGFGDDNKYSTRGKWKVLQGTVADPSAIVYRLEPEQPGSQSPLLLQRADDILFFLDNDTHLLVGNNYCSYTLNKN